MMQIKLAICPNGSLSENICLPDAMSIYVPYIYQLDGGYKLNDKFEMSFKDTKITFTIKGFTEDVFFSSSETGLMGVYLPHDTFEKVSGELGDTYNATVIFANLKKINKDVETGIRELTKADIVSASTDITSTLFSLDLPLIKLSRVMMASMVSIMIVAFAAIIVAVCLIVVRFRIGNSIEDDMTKIGSLKAIGYTSRQIVFSIVMQFVINSLCRQHSRDITIIFSNTGVVRCFCTAIRTYVGTGL